MLWRFAREKPSHTMIQKSLAFILSACGKSIYRSAIGMVEFL